MSGRKVREVCHELGQWVTTTTKQQKQTNNYKTTKTKQQKQTNNNKTTTTKQQLQNNQATCKDVQPSSFSVEVDSTKDRVGGK